MMKEAPFVGHIDLMGYHQNCSLPNLKDKRLFLYTYFQNYATLTTLVISNLGFRQSNSARANLIAIANFGTISISITTLKYTEL